MTLPGLNRLISIVAIALAIGGSTHAQNAVSVQKAATKFVPEVAWQSHSTISADFTCRHHIEQAILGTSSSEIVIAIFINGLNSPPEILHYSAKARDPKTAELKIEDMDYDPREMVGYVLEGFTRSKTCKGLNLSDGNPDSAHIYWNDKSHKFDEWQL